MYKVKRVRGCKEEIRKGSYRIAKRNRCNNACLVPSSHAVINCALAVTIHIVESSREWREESGEWRVESGEGAHNEKRKLRREKNKNNYNKKI